MIIRNIIILLLLSTFYHQGNAQNGVEDVMASIKKNNKQILANVQYNESERLRYKTGLTLPNPAVGFDFMAGSPATAGNQTDMTITQSFDFPTAYARKKELSHLQIEQIPYLATSVRQNVLLEAQKTCNEIIYLKKMIAELTNRKANAQNLNNNFKKSLEIGEGNMIDVNKTKLLLAETNVAYRHHQSLLQLAYLKLKSLNGNIDIRFEDSIYATPAEINSIADLETLSILNDPNLKYLESSKMIAQQEIAVAKAMTLPKMEAGYHYQAILGQRFQGGHVGFSIPLWENRNLVKSKDAKFMYADLQLEEMRNQRYFELRQIFETYESTKILLDEYKSVLTSINSLPLLNKALDLGQISTLDYFIESTYYNNVTDNFLKIEKEFYNLIYEINKYKL